MVAFLASSGKETIPNFKNYFMVFFCSLFGWVKLPLFLLHFFYLPLPCARRGDVRVKKSGFEIWPKQMANCKGSLNAGGGGGLHCDGPKSH